MMVEQDTRTETTSKWILDEVEIAEAIQEWLYARGYSAGKLRPDDLDWAISQGDLLKGVTVTKVTHS